MSTNAPQQEVRPVPFPAHPNQSQTIGKLAEALSKAQSTMQAAKKDAENPFFHSKYADLAACWDCCRKPLTDNGLAVIQTTTPTTDGTVRVVSTLAHISGEWIKGELAVKPVKPDPQSLGSALTYARRYSLCSLVGIVADEDDDGNYASGHAQKGKKNQSAPPRQQAPRQQAAPPQTPPQGQSRPQTAPNQQGQAQAGAGITEPQLKAIWGISKGKGLEAHQAASDILGRPVNSLNDLTKKEAGTIIDALQKM